MTIAAVLLASALMFVLAVYVWERAKDTTNQKLEADISALRGELQDFKKEVAETYQRRAEGKKLAEAIVDVDKKIEDQRDLFARPVEIKIKGPVEVDVIKRRPAAKKPLLEKAGITPMNRPTSSTPATR
jgi:predicted Holliday junction resolvase-like endonuclease